MKTVSGQQEKRQNSSEDKIKDEGDAVGNIKGKMIVTYLYEKGAKEQEPGRQGQQVNAG